MGLRCSRSNFYKLIHNTVYIGQITIIGRENKTPNEIQGKHEAIISTQTFIDAQASHSKEKRKITSFRKLNSRFPLKGFILCPKCNKELTASTSSGRSHSYSYYHCTSACGFRVRIEEVHQKFEQQLSQMQPLQQYVPLLEKIIEKANAEEAQKSLSSYSKGIKNIDQLTNRLSKAKDLLLDGFIDLNSFSVIKKDIETQICVLGDIISIQLLKQRELLKNQQDITARIHHLDKIWDSSEDDMKLNFANCFLKPGWGWNESHIEDMFKLPIQFFYGIKSQPDMKLDISKELSEALEKIVELLKRLPF